MRKEKTSHSKAEKIDPKAEKMDIDYKKEYEKLQKRNYVLNEQLKTAAREIKQLQTISNLFNISNNVLSDIESSLNLYNRVLVTIKDLNKEE